jgi:hypothetical protein
LLRSQGRKNTVGGGKGLSPFFSLSFVFPFVPLSSPCLKEKTKTSQAFGVVAEKHKIATSNHSIECLHPAKMRLRKSYRRYAHVKLPMIDASSRNQIFLVLSRTSSHLVLTVVALSGGNEKESLTELILRPRYYITCDGSTIDISQLMKKPRFCNN